MTSIDSLFAEPEMGVIPSSRALHPGGGRFIFGVYAGGDTQDKDVPARGRLILVQNFFEELKAKVSH